MLTLLSNIDRGIGWVCRWILYITLTIVFLILSINVGLRYIAGTSLAWASELPELLFPWMIMAGVVIAVQHGSHISVVILTQKLPLLIRRYVLVAGSCIVALLYGSLAVMAWPLVEIAADEKTPILQMPGSYSMACLMFGFAMLAVMTICKLPSVWQAASASNDLGASA